MVSQFWSYRWNLQLMAANGYIVVAPNRRGLPGFGQAWNEQISGDWGGQPMRDYLSAIDDVSKEPYVNKDRLGCVGASYGGYSVYYLAGIHQKRFKCFIAHCGLFNLESWYGATEELFFANFDMKGAYWQTPEPTSYAAYSPHKFVKNWDTPILVIHSEKDFRVPVTEGMQGHPQPLPLFPGRRALDHYTAEQRAVAARVLPLAGWVSEEVKMSVECHVNE
jgi:dipeptidyl aminopeptidase/acylaminoacyl peptidase